MGFFFFFLQTMIKRQLGYILMVRRQHNTGFFNIALVATLANSKVYALQLALHCCLF